MTISQKCQYALRAVFELSKHQGKGPIKIRAISEAQAIPQRFLEGILAQLKQMGVVQSARGKQGGYLLGRRPDDLTIGEVIRVIDGPIVLVDCAEGRPRGQCTFNQHCVFWPVWETATRALSDVYDSVTFSDLVEDEKSLTDGNADHYEI